MKSKQPLKANKKKGKFVKKEINVDKQELTFPGWGGTSNRVVNESNILCSMYYVLRFMFYFMLYYILCSILCSIYVPFHVRRYIILLQNSDTQFLLFQMIDFHCSQYWSLVSPLLLASLSSYHRGK